MIYSLTELQQDMNTDTQLEDGSWVPARPINYKYEGWFKRLKDAWKVFTGKADAFTWPEDES